MSFTNDNNDETPTLSGTPTPATPSGKKRGRKSKKELLAALNLIEQPNNETEQTINSLATIAESFANKANVESFANNNVDANETNANTVTTAIPLGTPTTAATGKKRGRKPKGGKIIQQIEATIVEAEIKPNVILHLKCSMKDLTSPTSTRNDIEAYDKHADLSYDLLLNHENNTFNNNSTYFYLNNNTNTTNNNTNTTNGKKYSNSNLNDDDDDYDDNYQDDVWRKLKQLEHNLHVNNISDKKSACFWCTCDFDNPPIYVPRCFMNGSYQVYGCFCSPECATAHLMEENIDSSTKFERYHLLNHIYSKIYNYKKNIKPAPNPYYMLEKFYGNLSIQEYRALLQNERLFLIVDKPLTRVLPELHEDNDEFILNNKIIPSNNYQVKKRLQRKPQNKSNAVNEKFGILSQ